MKFFEIETIVDRVTEEKPGELHAIGKNSEGVEGQVALTDIRGAISPPAADIPGYWLVMGTKYRPNDKGKPVRLFLSESESRNHMHLIDNLAEAAGKYRVRELYCPENSGLYSSVVQKFRSINGVTIRPAPMDGDIDHGISFVYEALENGCLEIPKGTILRGQLEQMTANSLGYTLHALRYLLAGFSLYHSRRSGSVQVQRGNHFYG